MYKITAINEETDTEDEDDTKVTKEAEETIVVSEYMRALQMQKNNEIDDALSLFNELLETQVLYEITKTDTAKQLISIKYNCLKNIGFIHNNKNDTEKALEFLIKAIELDDTDVYILNKLGQIALQTMQLDIAQMAFEKCLKQNPNHWPSGDGILQILCMREEYNEAYGWALMWYEKNPKYTRGLDVILEVREKFGGLGLDYIENSWSIKFNNRSLKRTNKKSVFPERKSPEPPTLIKPNIDQFKIESFESLNWLTFGEFITNVYDHLSTTNDGVDINYSFSYTDFLLKQVQPETPPESPEMDGNEMPAGNDVEMDGEHPNNDIDVPMDDKQENSNSNGPKSVSNNPDGGNSVDGSTEDSTQDAPNNSEDGTKPATKPKSSRRRGSDLKLLEPWCYWDRNRKQSQRQKNKQIERLENDTSINGILRKILPKYFEENFDSESPFHPNNFSRQDSMESLSDDNSMPHKSVTIDQFQEATANVFADLIKEIKESSFDVINLVTKWTQCISKFWERTIPIEVLDLYLKIYRHHLNHNDSTTWILLDKADFQAEFQMALFYLELSHQKAMQSTELNSRNDVDEQWFKLFHHLIFQCGFNEFDNIPDETIKYQKRINWLQYCLARYEYDLPRAVNCLESIRDVCIGHDESNILFLPNHTQFQRIDVKTINDSIVMLERTISLNNVKQLYANENYLELITILKDSLINSTKTKNADNTVMRITTQFEIILECFWNVEMFEDCLIWSERCLRYTLDRFIVSPKNSKLYDEWAQNINFILTYIEALIVNESYMIVNCLKKYYARLIQSIVRIISNQLDAPQEKNTNQMHPIDIRMPWIILHHILQREEDLKPHPKRKLSNDNTESNEKESSEEAIIDVEEDTIPKSIAIFFTAHEYLGSRSWCTKDKGQLLLYILNLVVPRLRTPYLEAFRDIIAEYLEQVTYCLYGYPAKRARLKHIEEHDAHNVELEWSHAVQLYDLYRPDDLPEFDSYKNDSITSEMEQLLQRILAIIPPDIDPSSHSEEMEKFIRGEIDELPKPLDILPYRINSIYYLLADHYFKNRDFSKTVKYYVLDLSNCPTRFDAWAGLALSKASTMETKLNACTTVPTNEWIQQSEEVLRCFKQCLKIDAQTVSLWIEYGSYAYALHSYCSRCMKQSSDSLSMEKFSFLEEKKEESLKIAHECFTTIDQFKMNLSTDDGDKSKKSDDDEKWLYHYMLGKVSEKRKESPNTYIEHYLKSAQYLYEHNATYPFKISFNNPQNLSLEALEIFYRITAAIIKYIEQHSVVTKGVGRYFIKVLKQQAKSPFAMSQAKINENSVNAFKRKLSLANEEAAKQKMAKVDTTQKTPNQPATGEAKDTAIEQPDAVPVCKDEPMETTATIPSADTEPKAIDSKEDIVKMETDEPTVKTEAVAAAAAPAPAVIDDDVNSPLRRGSQESTATTTTQTTTTTSSDSTSSSSSDSDSTSSSSYDSSSEDDLNKDENAPLDEKHIDSIYRMCIKNLEECVTRFPEHYKSIYRLVQIYMNGPERMKNTEKCNQLLLGTYTTELGNQIQGLFTDRKTNNLFNGIWRNPSSEIDRPGSFSSHLSKCVNMLMQILRINLDYKLLLEIIFHLQRVPDADKRYIKDSERKELLEHAITFCAQSFKDLLKKHSVEKPDDNEMLLLIVEIYKAHKKCLKNASQKESPFSGVMVDTYKAYIQGKVDWLPDNVNYIDLATKLCLYEINYKKNQDKQQQTGKRHSLDELGFGGLAASLSKINTSQSGVIGIPPSISQPPVSLNSPSVSTPPKVTTPIVSTITTTASITTTPVTSTITSTPFIPGITRPRGRPPGSKNINVKSNDAKRQSMPQMPSPSISTVISSLLKPLEPSSFAGSLPNLNVITAHLEPAIKQTILTLLSQPSFMTTLAQFADPASMNTFLTEYFRLSNLPNVSQLVAGFTGVMNCIAASFQPPTSITPTVMTPSPIKAPIIENSPSLLLKSSAMSIFPTPSKPISSTPQPQKLSMSSAATITPIPSPIANQSPSSLLKPGPSTVISVGSGQLTITPSISITPNLSVASTSMHAPLMQMPNFAQATTKTALPMKVKQKPGPKPGSKHTSKTGLKPGPKPKNQQQQIPQYPGLSVDLPKSLSITPSPSNFMPPSQIPLPMGAELIPNKPPKQTKPRKKSLDAPDGKASNKANISIPKMPTITQTNLNQQIESQMAMINKYKELMRANPHGPNFMSQFEQFLSGGIPPDLMKGTKLKASAATLIPQPKGTIKPKQLEQLQGPSAVSKSVQKSNKPTFTTPSSGMHKNQTMATNAAALNSFGTTISSLPHATQQIQHAYPSLLSASPTLPANLQISPTKTLQQKLAERQKQFSDVNSTSRPSSTSSAGSAKTRKSDNDVIVLD